MKMILKIMRYELNNLFRSKWIILYTIFFFLLSYVMFTFERDGSKAILTLLNVVLIVIPLVSVIFGTMYLYNSREFIEMVLCQPIDRTTLFYGLFLGTSIPLASGFVVGVSLPYFLFGQGGKHITELFILLIIGVSLNFIFCAVSFLISIKYDDKSKGLGFAIAFWLFFGVIYDGLILFVIYYFQEYPIENPVLIMSILNPIDLGRIFFLLNFDVATLMGYTGALFNKFFGSTIGTIISTASILLWIQIPFYISLRMFRKKDF